MEENCGGGTAKRRRKMPEPCLKGRDSELASEKRERLFFLLEWERETMVLISEMKVGGGKLGERSEVIG